MVGDAISRGGQAFEGGRDEPFHHEEHGENEESQQSDHPQDHEPGLFDEPVALDLHLHVDFPVDLDELADRVFGPGGGPFVIRLGGCDLLGPQRTGPFERFPLCTKGADPVRNGHDGLGFLFRQVAASVTLQHVEQNGMGACGMSSLIAIQCGQRSMFEARDRAKSVRPILPRLVRDGEVQTSLHVPDVAEHLRRGDDTGNRNALMAIDVAVHP